jgi:hypothetical protein
MIMIALFGNDKSYHIEKETKCPQQFIEIYNDNRIDWYNNSLKKTEERIKKGMIIDLLNANMKSVDLDEKEFFTENTVNIASLKSIFDNNKRKELGIYRLFQFSLPGYNQDRDKSIVVLFWIEKPLVGGGHIVYYEKKDDKWRIENVINVWAH